MIRVKRSTSNPGRNSVRNSRNSVNNSVHNLVKNHSRDHTGAIPAVKTKGHVSPGRKTILLRILVFLAIIAVLSAALLFLNTIPGRNGIYSGYNRSDRLLPDGSLNVTLSDAAISGNINSSAHSRNSIFINLVNVTTEGDDMIFTFDYTLALNMSHICEFGFRFDGVYVDMFDQKVRIDPGNGGRFSLFLTNAPRNYENSVIYSCVVE